MKIKTTVKADVGEIKKLKNENSFKNEINYLDYIDEILTEAFELGRTYEREKSVNKLD